MSSSSSSDDDAHASSSNGRRGHNSAAANSAPPDPLDYFLAPGDAASSQYDAKDVPLDARLLAATNKLAVSLKNKEAMCVHISEIPEESASWAIDNASPNSFKALNNNKANWKEGLDAPDQRSFEEHFPRVPHVSLARHTLTLEASYPPNREYASVEQEARALAESKEAIQVEILPSSAAKSFFDSVAEDSVGKSKSQYQAVILKIKVVNVRNPYPFSVAVNLSTVSPCTGEAKVWCNTASIAPNSRFTKNVYRVPAVCDLHGLNDVVYTIPDIHRNADFSRWINVSATKLARDLKALEFDNTLSGVLSGQPFYRIECPPIPTQPIPYFVASTEKDPGSKKVIWWICSKHHADIQTMTAKLVGGMNPEYEQLTSRKEVLDPITGVTVRFYNVCKQVYDTILQRYLPYMKHDNFLMGIGKGIFMNIACDKQVSDAKKDIDAYSKDNSNKYGSFRISFSIEYEKFDPSHGVVDKEYLKKREKAAAKANAQIQKRTQLQTTSQRPSLPLYNSNLHQLRAEENNRGRLTSTSTTTSVVKKSRGELIEM